MKRNIIVLIVFGLATLAMAQPTAEEYRRIQPIILKLEKTHRIAPDDLAYLLVSSDSPRLVARHLSMLGLEEAVIQHQFDPQKLGALIRRQPLAHRPLKQLFMC